MSFVKLNNSSSKTLSDILRRFGCIISPLCEITLSTVAELAGSLHRGRHTLKSEHKAIFLQNNEAMHEATQSIEAETIASTRPRPFRGLNMRGFIEYNLIDNRLLPNRPSLQVNKLPQYVLCVKCLQCCQLGGFPAKLG